MLVKLTPEQVEQNWNVLWSFLQRALPTNIASETGTEINVLRSILMEIGTVWIDYGEDGQGRAMLLTTVMTDQIALGKALLIYAMVLFPWAKASVSDYRDGAVTLKLYAKEHDCLNILMYVQDERFVRFLRQIGVETSQQLLTIEV